MSRFPSFKRGLTKALLKSVGKKTIFRDWLTVASMFTDTELKYILKREVGRGSREHVAVFSSVTTFLRVSAHIH